MPTAKGGYYTADGKRVPSVTTIIGRFKESGALINWAWKLGTEGKDYREVRDAAADAGTMAHEAIEIWAKGSQPSFPDDEMGQKAATAFRAFQDWHAGSRIQLTHTELSMVSERHRFGGTLDAVGLINNRIVLLDWKTGRMYPDHLIQMAAYGALLQEVRGIQVTGYHLCRFSRETGDFAHYSFEDVSDGWQAFLHLRALYDIDKELKGRVK